MTIGPGDLDSIKALAPVDATTNPSLILAAVSDPKFAALVDEAIKSAKGATTEEKVCCSVLHWVALSCKVCCNVIHHTEEKVCCRVLHWHWVALSCKVL